MTSNQSMCHKWKAGEYHLHSSVQEGAAKHLLQCIAFNGDECVLDVGCGDGKITANIAGLLPGGAVLGVDISPEMIGFAQRTFPQNLHSNLQFHLQDGQKLNEEERFDIIFSSFAVQWMDDLHGFFKGVRKSLKSYGYLAATIPLGISSALEEAIRTIISCPEWALYFKDFQIKKTLASDAEYKHLLMLYQFEITQFGVIEQTTTFESREKFEKYVLAWFPYLQPLPSSLQSVFFKKVIDQYLKLEPLLNGQSVLFRFPRLDIIAKKAIL